MKEAAWPAMLDWRRQRCRHRMPFHGSCRFTGGRGFAMTVPVWVTPISMVVYTVLLMLLTEFMRRHYRTSMWVWVVSLVTIPLWIANIPAEPVVPGDVGYP